MAALPNLDPGSMVHVSYLASNALSPNSEDCCNVACNPSSGGSQNTGTDSRVLQSTCKGAGEAEAASGEGKTEPVLTLKSLTNVLRGLLACLTGEYIAQKSAFAKEKELLLQELEDAYLKQLSLLDDIEAGSDQKELLVERNEDLDKDLMEEKYRVHELFKVLDEYEARLRKADNENEELRKKNEECQDETILKNKEVDVLKEQLEEKGAECARNGEIIQELKTQIMDDDVYSGFLEEKVKYHEGERKQMKQKVSDLEGNVKELHKEVNVLRAGNSDLRNSLEREAQNNLGMEKKVQKLEDQNQSLQRDLAEKESQIVASMETVKVERSKNEILADEVRVMKNWVAQLAGEKEKLNDLLLEKELEIRSVRLHMKHEKGKNQVLTEEGQVLKNWIAEVAGENAKLKDRLAEKEMEENAINKVSEMLTVTEEKVQERLTEAEEKAYEKEFNEDKECHSQEENEEADDSDKINEVEAEFAKENGKQSQEENGEGETENQEDVEVSEDRKGCCEEETELENEESPKINTEENKQPRRKKNRGKKRKRPARQEDSSRQSVVQSMTLETHCENLHSIMLPAEFQELLQKNEKGLTFIKYKNKVLLNFMHHDKASVRAVLSRCSKCTAEEVLSDLQKLVLTALTKD
ncbi:uncharacterized protein [Macrobrachium rosenbergii]|uniref:uncharacterized protein n=1 Tax=Macrobrachium rosenbergii TaxID=79674 RepID=UPI0034D6023B